MIIYLLGLAFQKRIAKSIANPATISPVPLPARTIESIPTAQHNLARHLIFPCCLISFRRMIINNGIRIIESLFFPPMKYMLSSALVVSITLKKLTNVTIYPITAIALSSKSKSSRNKENRNEYDMIEKNNPVLIPS